jgi:transposase
MNTIQLSEQEQRQLSETLRRTHDAHLYQRTLAVLECSQGKPVTEVARSLQVTRQSIHNWVTRFLHTRQVADLVDGQRCGRPRRMGMAVDQLLQALMLVPPARFSYHATHWTVPLLQDQLRQNLGQSPGDTTVRQSLHRLGYRWKRPRYVLLSDPLKEKKTPLVRFPCDIGSAQRPAGGR